MSTDDYWESNHVLDVLLTLPTNLTAPLALDTFRNVHGTPVG